jgi:hypothetical protein
VQLRALTALAVLVLAATIVVLGCGDDEDPAGTTTEAATATEPTGEKTTTTDAEGLAGEETTTTPEQTTVPEEGAGEVGPQRTPAEDEAAIKETLASVLLVSADPAEICGQLLTDAYVQRSYGSGGGCRAAQDKQSAPEVLTFGKFEISIGQAHTVVGFQGGVYDGEKGNAELVVEDGRWKLDSLQVDVPAGP